MGLAFEHYDFIGKYLTMRDGAPVDAHGDLNHTDVDGPFKDVVEMSGAVTWRAMQSMHSLILTGLLCSIAPGGCQQAAKEQALVQSAAPPSHDARESLTLQQIKPRPQLPPTSRPSLTARWGSRSDSLPTRAVMPG